MIKACLNIIMRKKLLKNDMKLLESSQEFIGSLELMFDLGTKKKKRNKSENTFSNYELKLKVLFGRLYL